MQSFIRTFLPAIVVALAASSGTFAPTAAEAQKPVPAAAATTPRISGFDVQPAAQPSAGQELFFTLYGTPGGTARVQIAGGGSAVLDEVESGVYEGSYTISVRDRITAQSAATVNLRVGNRVATGVLDEALVAGAPAPRPGPDAALAPRIGPDGAPAPRPVPTDGGAPRPAGTTPPQPVAAADAMPLIERFDIAPASRLAPGAELPFTVAGTPGGEGSVRIAGVRGKLILDEVRRGVYEGTYVVRERDRLAPDAEVTANLRVGAQETSRRLDRPLLLAAAAKPATKRVAETCLGCGVVTAIQPVDVKGNGSYVGKIGGGVVGAILGSQIGGGHGRTAAQIAGAIGGAVAGNEIEKRTRTSTHYEVVVRLDNGGTRTVSYEKQPPFSVGSRVRLENGELRGA